MIIQLYYRGSAIYRIHEIAAAMKQVDYILSFVVLVFLLVSFRRPSSQFMYIYSPFFEAVLLLGNILRLFHWMSNLRASFGGKSTFFRKVYILSNAAGHLLTQRDISISVKPASDIYFWNMAG